VKSKEKILGNDSWNEQKERRMEKEKLNRINSIPTLSNIFH